VLACAAQVVVEAFADVVLAGLGEELDVAVDHLQVGVAHELHEFLERVAGGHEQRRVGVAALVEGDPLKPAGGPCACGAFRELPGPDGPFEDPAASRSALADPRLHEHVP
jgi:hypothetical protein